MGNVGNEGSFCDVLRGLDWGELRGGKADMVNGDLSAVSRYGDVMTVVFNLNIFFCRFVGNLNRIFSGKSLGIGIYGWWGIKRK